MLGTVFKSSLPWIFAGAVMATVAADVDAEADTFIVLINANNGYSGDAQAMKMEIKRLYLKEKTAWPDDEKSSPFGRPVESVAHKAFIKGVLGMTEAQLHAHWNRLKQTTGDTPPRAVGTPRTLLRQIARKKGAFSVVAEKEIRKLPARVRVLFKFSGS